MLEFLKSAKSPLMVAAMDASHLHDCAKIHAQSFAQAWSDGTLEDLLHGSGMAGLVAIRERWTGGYQVEGFIIFRVVAREAEIITIATAKSARHKGVARALMESFIRHCLTERLEEIFLEVEESNLSAINLYRKYGFTGVGKRKAYYGQGGSATSGQTALQAGDAIIMKLDLRD